MTMKTINPGEVVHFKPKKMKTTIELKNQNELPFPKLMYLKVPANQVIIIKAFSRADNGEYKGVLIASTGEWNYGYSENYGDTWHKDFQDFHGKITLEQ